MGTVARYACDNKKIIIFTTLMKKNELKVKIMCLIYKTDFNE